MNRVSPAGSRPSATPAASSSSAGRLRPADNLVRAIVALGGMQIAFVASPGEAVKIALRAGPEFRFPVLASNGLAAGVVLCVALPALAAAVNPEPRFDISKRPSCIWRTRARLRSEQWA